MSAWLNGPGWHSAIFITATLLLLIGIIATAATRMLRHDQDPELENHLDAQTLSSLPDLRTSDLVGADRNPDPRTTAAGVAAGEDPRLADGGDGPQSLRPVPAGTAVLYGRPVARLSGAQRKRALRKGRLPRDLAGGVAPAPVAGQHHLPGPDEARARVESSLLHRDSPSRAGESFRRAEATQFWTQLARDRDTAYQAWADGFGRLERTDWLELAA